MQEKARIRLPNKPFLDLIFDSIKQDWWSFLIIVSVGLLAGYWLLLPGYFNMHDDLQMMRQLVMDECFRDLQIPCRWTPHMGYGFGFPLFNYYPPLPYLVGQLIHVLGFSFVDTVKLTFLLSFVLSGITMYLLAREFWGKLGGVMSAVFYVWAPYHSVDIYVRGAMNEAWALVWFPLALWSSYKLILDNKFVNIVLLTLSLMLLLLSHNLMAMIFAPLFGVWVLFWLLKEKKWSVVPQFIISGVWALGLAAFFTIPVFLEQKLVHVETLVEGYYEYIAHFASTNQLLLSRFWGYGPSAWTTDDKMSFQIGHLHWGLSILILTLALYRIYRKRKFENLTILVLSFFSFGWFFAFMAQTRSTPIWLALNDFIKFVQFPWRFLTLVILCFSFLAGSLTLFYGYGKGSLKFVIVLVFSVGLILLNKDYFKPESLGPLTDQEKFSGAAWELQQTAGIYDYLPNGAKTAPKAPQKTLAEIKNGEGEISETKQITNYAEFLVNVKSDEAYLEIGIFEFPGWRVYVDGKITQTKVGNDELGRMHITIPRGNHQVQARLENTPVRTTGNMISLVSWALLLTTPIWRKKS